MSCSWLISPCLLQSEAYARAVMEAYPDATEDVVSERLAGRLSRQAILERDDPPPPVVCALIDHSALNREIGVLVRDSKNPDRGRLGFSAQTWREFAARIKSDNAG